MNRQVEGHTVQRFDAELSQLHMLVLEMGTLVVNQVQTALHALTSKDLPRAREGIARDYDVDAMEVQIDDEIISVIARRGPVARDLRTVMAFSKMVSDLERAADEAARIAGLALHIYDNETSDPSIHLLRDVLTMGKLAAAMLREALETFDQMDVERADELAQGHTELDAEFRSSVRRLITFVMEDARNVGHTVNMVLVIKSLERIGDYAKNIAEYVIYLVRGTDIRHQSHQLPNWTPQAPGAAAGDDA
jgi:phosphate transport system protein